MKSSEIEHRLGAIRPSPPSDGLRRRVAAELSREPRPRSVTTHHELWARGLATAAVLLLAAAVWLTVVRSTHNLPPDSVVRDEPVPHRLIERKERTLSLIAYRRAAAVSEESLMEQIDARWPRRSAVKKQHLSVLSWSEFNHKESL